MKKQVKLTRPTRAVASPGRNEGGGPPKGNNHPPTSSLPEQKKKEEKSTVAGVDSLLDAATKLTAAEQRELLAKLSLQAQDAGNQPSRDKDMWSTSVHGALLAVVGVQDRASAAPMLIRRAMGASAAWLPVAEFMELSGLDRLKVVERQSVYEFLARLVVKRSREVAQHVKAPLTPKLVAGQAQSIAALFEVEFPGYLAAGLAGIVAKRIISGYQPPAEPADRD